MVNNPEHSPNFSHCQMHTISVRLESIFWSFFLECIKHTELSLYGGLLDFEEKNTILEFWGGEAVLYWNCRALRYQICFINDLFRMFVQTKKIGPWKKKEKISANERDISNKSLKKKNGKESELFCLFRRKFKQFLNVIYFHLTKIIHAIPSTLDWKKNILWNQYPKVCYWWHPSH